jgi:hypothetical protein
MNHSDSDSGEPLPQKTANTVSVQSVKEKRLADALRKNLLRRKAGAKASASSTEDR